MNIYIVYEWYADSDRDSCHIEKTKDIVAVYDSLEKAETYIGDKPTKMGGLWSSWWAIEKHEVK
jgi:hypothetical protein